MKIPMKEKQPKMGEALGRMVDNFGQHAFTSKPGKGLQLYPNQSDDEEDEGEGEGEEGDGTKKQKKKKEKKGRRGDKYSQFAGAVQNQADSIDVQNLYTEDPNKIDIINNLTSIKLL